MESGETTAFFSLGRSNKTPVEVKPRRASRTARGSSLYDSAWESLGVCADRLHRGSIRWRTVTSYEEVMVVHVAIHVSGDLCRFGAECRAPALQEDHDYHPPYTGVGVGSEPAIARSVVRAGTRLTEDLLLVEIEPQAASGSVLHRAGHPVRQLGNDGSDVELPLHSRLEGGDLIGSRGMLQVIERAAIGDRRNHRA